MLLSLRDLKKTSTDGKPQPMVINESCCAPSRGGLFTITSTKYINTKQKLSIIAALNYPSSAMIMLI